MIKKTVMGGWGLVFLTAFAPAAIADQSIGFQHYYKEGVQAFKEHDDQKAVRCFKIAQIYDPSDDDLGQYLSLLAKRGVVLELPPPEPSKEMVEYRYYFREAIRALNNQDGHKAVHYFMVAQVFYPGSKEVQRYLGILSQRHGVNYTAENQPQIVQVAPVVTPIPAPQAVTGAPSMPVSQSAAEVSHQPSLYVSQQKVKQPPPVISLAQLTNNGQIKAGMQIEYHSSVIIEGRNIQRFLVVDEGFITVRIIDGNRLEVGAQGIGTTFLHIWDDAGLHTIYVEVIFPKSVNTSGNSQELNGVYHSRPFIATYTNDWDTYYTGKNVSQLKRQNYNFNQTLAVTGETPYGFFDSLGSYSDFDSVSEFDSYSIGLSQIPLEGTGNFDLRGFDAVRRLSPLTMPSTRLRGAFADVDLFDDVLGLSVSHGQEQVPLGFLTIGQETQFNNSYIDAAKLTLFPKSDTDRYSLNFATGYGSDRPTYLTNHVYSVEGEHKLNDFLTLHGEEGYDSTHDASLASLKWQEGTFKSGLNFRNIDKNYSTISTLPAYQGETGVDWTTDADFSKFTESTFLEAYRDRLDYNPGDPSSYNYDGNGQLRLNIAPDLWTDSNINYVDTPGELSPMTSTSIDERLSKSFGIWRSLKGTVFGGAGYQYNHASNSAVSDFDREYLVAGVQLPLTRQISTYANYEYDFLDQYETIGNTNPSVINAGFEYEKQFTPKLSFNSQISYHDELGVKTTNSVLSGEESVIFSSGFNYTPTPDINIFADGNASKVLFHIGNPPYDDFEVHLGMRVAFGGAAYWDPMGIVSGTVFKDRSGNGKYNPGDAGIPGVKLKVGDKETITDKNGRYRIKIRAKGVDVAPELDSVPGGLIFSTPQALNVLILQGRTSHADFGLISQTGIYGLVFVDKKGARTPSEGDTFIGRVIVILDGRTVQKSDSHGAFYFRNIAPGQHVISIDLNSLALNMVPLVKLKNTIDVPEGSNYSFNIPVQIKQTVGEQE